jgi:hypothetical protein
MKKILFAVIAAFIIGLSAVQAQSPTPDPDTTSTPVKQTDPEVDVMPRDINYAGGMIRIMTEELPKAVKQTLDAGSGYVGWQKAKAYRDKSSREFLIEMKEGDKTRVYRFDKAGKPILD